MAETVESGEFESRNGYPIDLLCRLTAEIHHGGNKFSVEESDDVGLEELNLGLSLGGCFGVDPKEKRLIRSSTIAGISVLHRDADASAASSVTPLVVGSALIRTCSLPTETEEEWRKRKDMQSLRRMEVKRKRTEKQWNSRAGKDRISLERNCEEDKQPPEEGLMALSLKKGKVPSCSMGNGFSSKVALPFGLNNCAAASTAKIDSTNGRISAFTAVTLKGFPPPSQRSIGSQGSSSSGVSDFDIRPLKGLSSCMEARSPTSVQSVLEHKEQKPIVTPTRSMSVEKSIKGSGEEGDNSSKNIGVANMLMGEMGRNVVEEMPCVSTRGEGPNGRRIEGFLYKYRKGEEVRIVCVCHGRFLSPAEFVKHAGGGDVAHPLRHIVVNPSPSSIL